MLLARMPRASPATKGPSPLLGSKDQAQPDERQGNRRSTSSSGMAVGCRVGARRPRPGSLTHRETRQEPPTRVGVSPGNGDPGMPSITLSSCPRSRPKRPITQSINGGGMCGPIRRCSVSALWRSPRVVCGGCHTSHDGPRRTARPPPSLWPYPE